MIDPPSSASKIQRIDFDGTFSEPVDPNEAVCAAFTEPPKLSHKSVVLPGAKPCKPILKPEDRRIRRPRLNRGGSTIANLGVSSGTSYQAGYGSMNISSYERNLAAQTCRGNQLNQTGMRPWGAMEPAPKRHRQEQHQQQHPPYPSNPFNQGPPQNRQGMPQSSRPPWQGGGMGQHQQPGYNQWQQPYSGQGQQFNQQGVINHTQQQVYGYQQGYGQGNSYQQQSRPPYNQGGGYQQSPPPPPLPGRHQHTFQGYSRSAPPVQQPWQNGGRGANRAPPQQPPSRVNPNVMNNLRSQLANTLQQNRRGGQHGGNQR